MTTTTMSSSFCCSSSKEGQLDQQYQTCQETTDNNNNSYTKYFQSALIFLLSTNLLVMTAISCGYKPSLFNSSSSSSSSSQTHRQQRRNLRTGPASSSNNIVPTNPTSYYYSHFVNHESRRTLYRKSIFNGAVGTVGAQLNVDGLSSSSQQHQQPYEWTKQSIDCPPTPHLQITIPQHYSECFLLINVASGDRLFAENYNDVIRNENAQAEAMVLGRIGSVPSNARIADNQIWLNEYPLSYNNNNNGYDLVTIRHAATGRRLYADVASSSSSASSSYTGDDAAATEIVADLSVGFGVSDSTTSDPPQPNEIWQETVKYKYTNIL